MITDKDIKKARKKYERIKNSKIQRLLCRLGIHRNDYENLCYEMETGFAKRECIVCGCTLDIWKR